MTTRIMDLAVGQLTIGEDVRIDEDVNALDELAASVAALGILQPLIVRPVGDGWEVVAGRRRLAAARIAEMESVPCVVRDFDDAAAFDATLAENIHRRDLSWIEVALAYDRLRQRGLKQSEIAEVVGKHESQVSQVLKLLTLPKPLQDRVHRREISYSTALDLASRHRSSGTSGGPSTRGISSGADAQIATHWRRRHDRLLAGIALVIKTSGDAHELKQMLRRLLSLDRQTLDPEEAA